MEPSIILFDLDKTLAESKASIDQEMAELLKELLSHTKVCVVSGGGVPQFKKQFLDKLPQDTNLANLVIAPTSGAAMYIFTENGMQELYKHAFTKEERDHIIKELENALKATDFDFLLPSYGERVEDRDSQISFSILGQEAPSEEKEKIDPDQTMRRNIMDILEPAIPGFSARVGGSNTIDIARTGIDKAYAVDQVGELFNTPISEMVYVGDALYEGGNDEVVKQTGIETIQVSGPKETKEIIQRFL